MTPSPDVTQAHWLRDIVLFLGGQIAALFGSSIVAYTVVWYITLKTGSGSQYALLMIASQLTQGLTSIPGGVWADRYWRKALIMGADAATAVVTLALAIFFLTGHHDLWLIVVVLAMRGLS
ncbi:MAG: MFS transporter, partial [Propionibacteriaceae bacterium]|nr:MFS transporter [Propionibacteriaceae bacterium]